MKLHRSASLLAALAVSLLASSTALAYRPPARVLLLKAMEKQLDRGTRTMRVDADTQLFEVSGAPKGMPIPERTLLLAPSGARKESELGDGTRVEIRGDDKIVVKAPGQPDKSQKAPVDFLFDMANMGPPFDQDRAVERVMKDMKSLGISPEVVSFARFDGRVSYLIGSKPWETDKPQLWLDKDTLLPTRVVMVQKAADGKITRTDVRYLGWGSPIGGNWYPATIEVYTDDKLVRRTAVKSVDRNVPLDATLFQLR